MNPGQPSSFNYELLIAVIAVLISFISIGLTVWTIFMQRKHNRLSVKPIPEILLSQIEGVKIELKNLGIGPLICKELITKDESDNIKYHIKDFLPSELSSFEGRIFTNRWNFTLLPSESVTLFSITKIQDDEKDLEKVKKALGNLRLELKYTCMYNKTQPIYMKSLKWFKDSIKYQ